MRLPKYRRHSSSDRGFVEHNGKRHYFKGAYNSPESIDAYKAFIREVCGGVPIGGIDLPPPPSVAVLVERWLTWAEIHYGHQGEYYNCLYSTRPLLVHFGALSPVEFGPKRLKELQQHCLVDGKSRDFINKVTGRTKRCFKWAASEELIPITVYQALATVPGLTKGRTNARESKPRLVVPWEHVLPVLAHVNETVRTMLLIQWYTGVRSKSLCLAKPEQFDTTKTPWEWRPRHKQEHTGQELIVYLGPHARAALGDRIKGAPAGQYLFRPAEARRNKRYGAFYKRASYAQAVGRGIERANAQRTVENAHLPTDKQLPLIPHWSPHAIRRARSTAVRAKHGLEAAQAALGHQSIEAAELYAQRQMDTAKRIAEEEG